MVNFKEVKAVAEKSLAEAVEDPKWEWGVVAQEDKILIYWEYLLHYYGEDSYFTIKVKAPDTLVAIDDWTRVVGKEEIGGDLEQAVEKLIKWVVKVAHHYY